MADGEAVGLHHPGGVLAPGQAAVRVMEQRHRADPDGPHLLVHRSANPVLRTEQGDELDSRRFMENIVAPWSIGALRQGTYAFAMPPKRVLQLVALADIGAFVSALVERREQVFGKRFDFAGDELSGEEQAKILSHAIGRPINYQEIPIAAARQQSEDVALMFEWFDRVGADADIAALRRDFSEVRWHSFADWAREFDWSVLERTSSVA